MAQKMLDENVSAAAAAAKARQENSEPGGANDR
jgi:hypothetical protein